MNFAGEEMTHEEATIIYTMGLLEDARAKGLKGGRFRLDVDGMKAYAEMRKEKFRPTDKEIEAAFMLLRTPPDEIKQAYLEHGKIKFKWSSAHIWLRIMFARLLRKINERH